MPQLKPTRGICLNRNHPLSRGLVGLWPFNEGLGNKVFDLSGNGNTGTLTNMSNIWENGGVLISGDADDVIAILHKSNFNFNGGDCSFEILFKVKALPDSAFAEGLICKYPADVGRTESTASWINNNSPYKYEFRCRDADNDSMVASSITGAVVGARIHLVGVRDGSYVYIYINGVQEGSDSNATVGSCDNSDDLNIGRYGGGESSNIIVKKAALYNRALSSSEIALLYREPFCMFEQAMRPKLIGGQIVNLAGSSVALSSLSATSKAMRKVGGNVVSTTNVAAILNLIRSLLYIESNWKREALFNGMTANAFKLGTTLSLGWFWVRVAGCSVLYRGSSMGEIDFVNILAVAEQDACEISPPTYISHNSGSTYFYVVRRFNNCGYQECTLAASVKISIKSNGELAQPQPNKVFDSGAELVDGNKIKLVWFYCPLEQKSQPDCFNVYYDDRTGQIDYQTPLATIGYKGRKFYSYQCGALEAGRHLFAIRTEDVSGIENSSLARLRIQFVPTNPDAIEILSAEGV